MDSLAGLVEFARQECASGEWLYRGQPNRFTSVVPSLMREQNQWMHHNRLAAFEPRIAKALSAESPYYALDQIHSGLNTSPENAWLFDGTPNTSLATITPDELIRALAQHYDFPTFYVDVTFSPAVAAFFASHEVRDGRYVPTGDGGTVYRWPAARKSKYRLAIEEAGIGVVDLRPTTESFLRPHHQKAAVATPVVRPFDLLAPETLTTGSRVSAFVTPIRDLHLVDMAALQSCETFELSGQQAEQLGERFGVSQLALFPDVIDFGFSYFAVATFLSMAIHEPGYFDDDRRHDALLRGIYDRGLTVGRTILDREYLRLRGGALLRRPGQSFEEACAEIDNLTDGARRALDLMIERSDDADTHRHAGRLARQAYRVAAARHRELRRLLRSNPSVADVVPPKPRRGSFASTRSSGDSADTQWAVPEFERRVSTLGDVLRFADTLPVHLLSDDEARRVADGLFERDHERESDVRAALETARDWERRTNPG